MACINNNNNCGCENDPCGCKTKASEIVYQGPDLSCSGIETCTPLDEALQTLDTLICSPELIQIILNNLANNITLFNQFVTLVNNSIDCEIVQECITTSSTTTCDCNTYSFEVTEGTISNQQIAFFECGNITALVVALIQPGQSYEYCIQNANGIATSNKVDKTLMYCCPTTTTTTSAAPSTTTTTTVTPCDCTEWDWAAFGANISELNYVNCAGDVVKIPVEDITNNSGSICADPNIVPFWSPAPTSGTHILGEQGCCSE